MKRRELIKSAILMSSIAMLCGSGCSNENFSNSKSTKSNFANLKEQKNVYEVCTPLPFNYKTIDEMAEMNNIYKKSKIVSLYNNFPFPFAEKYNDFFGSVRGTNTKINSFDDFAKYVAYAKKYGFKFIYVLNSPKPFSNIDFNNYSKVFYELLDFLHDINVDNIKVANTQVASLINGYKYKFNLSASTGFEFHILEQYVNLVESYPNIDTIDISIDDNRNFKFIKNLKKALPDKKLEILVNEPCPPGCPARISHISTPFCVYDCSKMKEDPILGLCKTVRIYPWNWIYYQNFGINSFKFVSTPLRAEFSNLFFLKNYLDCVEHGFKDIDLQFLADKIFFLGINKGKNIKIKDIISKLPNIEYFIENGHNCSNSCRAECTYCYECANKIKQIMKETV